MKSQEAERKEKRERMREAAKHIDKARDALAPLNNTDFDGYAGQIDDNLKELQKKTDEIIDTIGETE